MSISESPSAPTLKCLIDPQVWLGGSIVSGEFRVSVRVKNHGRTPAEITDAVLVHEVQDRTTIIPDNPDYGAPRHKIPATSFLVTDDEFNFTEDFAISAAEREDVEAARKVLVVYGYVDYIDKFDQRHRAGYARVYIPATTDENFEAGFSGVEPARNNLAMFPNRRRNYDRRRLPGEGND